jgi:hypothetical protein
MLLVIVGGFIIYTMSKNRGHRVTSSSWSSPPMTMITPARATR